MESFGLLFDKVMFDIMKFNKMKDNKLNMCIKIICKGKLNKYFCLDKKKQD